MITLKQIINAAKAYHASRNALSKMGQAIYNIRNPENHFNTGFGFDSYETIEAGSIDTDYEFEEELEYDKGDLLIRVNYYHPRWEDNMSVIFPIDYLDGTEGYLEIEKAQFEQRKIKKEARERLIAEIQENDTRLKRRELFEQLKAEFEGTTND